LTILDLKMATTIGGERLLELARQKKAQLEQNHMKEWRELHVEQEKQRSALKEKQKNEKWEIHGVILHADELCRKEEQRKEKEEFLQDPEAWRRKMAQQLANLEKQMAEEEDPVIREQVLIPFLEAQKTYQQKQEVSWSAK